MTSWLGLEEAAPKLAGAVRARFEATKHHVLATVRKDGRPRVSGAEVEFTAPDIFMHPSSHPGSHRFQVSIDEVVLTGLSPERDCLVIQIWKPGNPVRRLERA